MTALGELAGRATITVPEAAKVLGIGRDAAYAAAERDEIPVLHLGRRLVVPVPRLLELLGVSQTDSEAAPASAATAHIHALTKSPGETSEPPTPAA